jgi:hypothetical protein
MLTSRPSSVLRPAFALVVLFAGARAAHAAPGELVLTPAPPIPLGSPATQLRVLDVSGDGIPDLIAGYPSAPGIQVLLGQGDGTFGAPIFTPMSQLEEFDLGDVNGDGQSDLVTVLNLGSFTYTMQVHLGDGSGAFVLSGGFDVSTFGGMYALRLLDLDEDGALDVVLEQAGQLRVCLGDGAGGFAAPGPFVSGGVALHQELHVLDANGDGHLDLMGCGNAIFPTGWSVYLGDGDGGLTFSQTGYNSVDGDLYGSALGDFDGDHRTDFVLEGRDLACGLTCFELGFAHNTGSGFAVPSPDDVLFPGDSRIRAGDLDGDGLADVVGIGSQVFVVLGQGDFTFAAPQYLAVGAYDLALADVDGDTRLDVLALQQSGSVKLLLNQSPPSGWTDLGYGLAGSDGIPSLLGVGEMQAGSPGALKLTHANPDKLAALFIGPASARTPFKGGLLVPVPPTMIFMLGTSPQGTITLPWNSWPHLPVGTDFFFQFAIVDSAGPAGASLSNAMRALQP